jgi:hypothetical protein
VRPHVAACHTADLGLETAKLVRPMSTGHFRQPGMLLDFAADRVIQKYQTSTGEQLKVQKDEPKSEKREGSL